LQRFDRSSFVEMDDGVELLRKVRLKVVAPALSLRAVNDADGSFEMCRLEFLDQIAVATYDQQKFGNANVVKHQLITIVHAGTDSFPLRAAAPIRCRGNGAGISGEANENRFASVPLTDELSNVQFTALAHLRGSCVPEMGVVRPHDGFRPLALLLQVLEEIFERINH